MTNSLSFFPVYDMAHGPRSKKLKFWMPLKHLFPDLLSSSYIVHNKVSISAYYSMERMRHNLRGHLGINDEVTVFMDSGGYQVMTDHFSGKPNDALEILSYQEENQADIGVTLDFPFKPNVNSVWEGLRRMDITLAYAIMALRNRQSKSLKLYAVIPGWDAASMKKASEMLSKYDFDGYTIGAPEPDNYRMASTQYLLRLGQMIRAVREIIGDKPLHVLGVSNLASVYVLAGLGVSSFDSLRYLHSAKFRDYMLPNGLMIRIGKRVSQRRNADELPCSCPICCETTADFLSHDGSTQGALIALHNLIVIKNHVKMINSALSQGWWKDVLHQGMRTFPSIVACTKQLISA
jgi:tRNA-guanine family transglycosylase